MSGTPRVLHVLRADHADHVGGDIVQVTATVDGLRAAGVDVSAGTVDDAPPDVAVVHVYNLQRPAALLRDLRTARRRWPSAAVVVSPVFWPLELRTMVQGGERALVSFAVKRGVKRSAWWPYVRRVLASAALVLPNSHAEVHALRRAFRLPVGAADDDRWAVVPNGIDLARWPFRRASQSERAESLATLGLDQSASLVVACVARVEAVKNQLAVVRAIEQLPDAVLVLVGPVGTDSYATKVRAAASDGPARGRAALTGRLAPEQVSELLAATDVHVLASFRETPGLATLEAAATGCGVVITAAGSATEYLGDDAHVADPANPASIAAAIRAAAADPRQPGARQRVEGYDWSTAVDALLGAYARLPDWPATARS